MQITIILIYIDTRKTMTTINANTNQTHYQRNRMNKLTSSQVNGKTQPTPASNLKNLSIAGQLIPFSGILMTSLISSSALATTNDNLNVSGAVNLIHQHSSVSNIDNDTTLSADLMIHYQTRHGLWNVHIEASNTPNENGLANRLLDSNADAGSALNNRDRGRLQLSELSYQFAATDNTQITAGLLDATGFIDGGQIMNDENHNFISPSLVNNLVIDFPDYVIGAALEYQYHPQWSGRVFISSTHGIADNNSRNYSSLFEVGDDEKGLFSALELGFKTENRFLNSGVWLHSGDHEALNNSQKTDLSNYGVYLSAGLQEKRHQYEVRVGWANPNVSAASQFASLAYQYAADNWNLGVGYSITGLSDELDATLPDPSLADNASTANPSAQTLEVYWHKPINQNWHITPSVQWFKNPLYASDNVTLDTELMTYNLRINYEF